MNVAFIFCPPMEGPSLLPPSGGAFIIVPLMEGVQGEVTTTTSVTS